jgi:hypothetical protein
MNNNRDFIDFLIALYQKKAYFFIFVLISFSVAIYFNININTTFKYSSDYVGHTEDTFTDFVLYEKSLNINSPVEFEKISLLDPSVKEIISSENICKMITISVYDRPYFLELADQYIATKIPGYTKDRELLVDKLISSVDTRPFSTGCIGLIFSGDKHTLEFLKNNYNVFLNKHIMDKFDKYFHSLERSRSNFYRNMMKSSTNDPSMVSYYSTRLKLIENLSRPNINISFFLEKTSNIKQRINKYFIYVFAFFMSILVFIVIVVFIDLGKQISLRKHTDSL